MALDFSKDGWFKAYLNFRKENPLSSTLPSHGVKVVEDTGLHNDLEQAIYYFLQPTGIMYGGLIEFPFPDLQYPTGKYFDSVDRVYMIFLESIFACLVSDRHFLLDDLIEEDDRFVPAVEVAMDFFLNNPGVKKKEGGFLKSMFSTSPEEKKMNEFEGAINRIITFGSKFLQRPELFNNGFLFLEIYTCLLWQRQTALEPDSSEEILQKLHATQMEQREVLLKLLICACQAEGAIKTREERLLEHFLKSSGLPKPKLAELKHRIKNPVPVEEVEIPEMPWIIRRFFLELILMAVLADRKLDHEEMIFVGKIAKRLDLWEAEVHQSLAALEVFLIYNDDKLKFMDKRSSTLSLKNRILEKASITIRKNLDRIVNEINETHELYNLLIKATKQKLDPEEKRKVHQQLSDILKTIPALAIFALPGGGIILPILIKLLPFNLLPSSFDD